MKMSESQIRAIEHLRTLFPLNEEATWQIFGEDPNCDFGGHHHEPLLMTIKGRYEDIIHIAIRQPNFFQWGAGGRIKKLHIIDTKSVGCEWQIRSK